MKNTSDDYNNVGPWLKEKLRKRQVSVSQFALLTRITSATIFRWFTDDFRPDPEKMKLVCECLSRLPVIQKNGSERFENVPWSEGLRQYVPKAKGAAAAKYNRTR